MDRSEFIRECIYSIPLPLLALKDKRDIDIVNSYLPYSTGFEIECNKGTHFNLENFKRIPDIIDINVDGSEQRYRIPNGIRGIFCLYNICQQLKYNSELNYGSGIHYHIDMRDCFSSLTEANISQNSSWILAELDKWEYKGTYNRRQCSFGMGWVRFSTEHRTMEIRIGEMSFDYKVLIKRIVHANELVTALKHQLKVDDNVEYGELDAKEMLEYIKGVNVVNARLAKLREQLQKKEEEEKSKTTTSIDEIRNIVNNRTTKLY